MKSLINRLINHKLAIYICVVLYLLYHLYTLDVSPLVWYDETVLNAITLDYIKNGTFFSNLDPNYTKGQEALVYGPVFFIVNGFTIQILGNDLWQARLVGLLSGFGILLYIYLVYRNNIKGNYLLLMIFLCFVLDPFFNASMHKGRYDTFGVLLILLSFHFIAKYVRDEKIYLLLISSIFFSMSCLTSMRLIPFGLPIGLGLIIGLFEKKRSVLQILINAITWVILPILSYLSWIFYKFNSINEYFDYLTKIQMANSDHLIGNLFIPVEVKPLVFVTLVSLIISLWYLRSRIFEFRLVFSFSYILLFYIIVGDVGPYSVMVIPIFYLFLMILVRRFDSLQMNNKIKPITILIIGLLSVNLSLFLLKSSNVLMSTKQRNHQTLVDFVNRNIPHGSKIIGEPKYYYAAINNNCEFQYANPVGFLSKEYNVESVENYRRVVFDYDYLLASYDMISDKRYINVVPQYKKFSRLEPIDSLKVPVSSINKLLSNIVSGYTFAENGYNGILYKRIR